MVSSIKNQDMIISRLELAKVYIRKDQPLKAIEIYQQGLTN